SNGKPDLSGHWAEPYTNNMAGRGAVLDPKTRMPITLARAGETYPDAPKDGGGRVKGFDLPYTELGLKEWKHTIRSRTETTPEAVCRSGCPATLIHLTVRSSSIASMH